MNKQDMLKRLEIIQSKLLLIDKIFENRSDWSLEEMEENGFNNSGEMIDALHRKRMAGIEKISGKSEFINGKYLDISLNKEKNSKFKILEIHSDIAKPLIKNYKFFDGLNQGDLIY